MMMRRLQDQRGVAALTVMLLTAVLGTAGAVVTLTATAELESGASDRRAEGAFAAAEAGLDIAAGYFKGNPRFGAGETEVCIDNPLVDASHGIGCEIRITSANGGEIVYPDQGRPYIEYTVMSRAKQGREESRTLAAIYRLEILELPFGLFVDGNVNLNGNPGLAQESLLVNGTVTDRSKLNTDANGNGQFDDPDLGWRFHKGMITSDPPPDMCTHPDGTQVGCTGVYSNFQIFSKNSTKNSDEIHFSSNDPALAEFPRDRDVHQTKVDGSGQPLPIFTVPRDPVLEVMGSLKDVAVTQTLYFDFKNGTNETVNFQPTNLQTSTRNFERNLVVYFDADPGDTIKWKVNLIPGSTSSDMKTLTEDGQRVGPASGVIVVRGGNLHLEAGTEWSGAIFVPEGELRTLGGNTCTCTIYAQGFGTQGGSSTIRLDTEWFDNLPAGFVSVTRQAFYECEPYQDSAVCPES